MGSSALWAEKREGGRWGAEEEEREEEEAGGWEPGLQKREAMRGESLRAGYSGLSCRFSPQPSHPQSRR
jgi:hypothetical protein